MKQTSRAGTKQLEREIKTALRAKPALRGAIEKIGRLYNNNSIFRIDKALNLLDDLTTNNINVNNKSIRRLNKFLELDTKQDEDNLTITSKIQPIELLKKVKKVKKTAKKIEPKKTNIIKTIDDKFNVNIDKNLNDKLKVEILNIYDDKRTQFIPYYIKEMEENFELLYSMIPKNFNFGIAIRGKQIQEIEDDGKLTAVEGDEKTIFKSFIDNNLIEPFKKLSSSGNLIKSSSRYYIITQYQLFYETGQGGSFKIIELDELKEYNIYSPSSIKSCGKECLKYYGVEAPKGFLSLSDMKSLSPIPVSDIILDVDEFIFLKENHYFRCIKKIVQKKQKRIERLSITDKKIENHINKLYNKKICVFDIETFGKNQTPIIIGFSFDGISFNYYYGSQCVEEFVKNLDCDYLVGFNSNKYDNILIRNEIIKQGYLIKDVPRSENNILKSFISKGDRNFECVDILNFTTGSLKKNLNNFKCSISKGEINYNNIKPDMSEDDKNIMIEYLKKDVLGTYELFKKLDEPFKKFNLSILELYTLSQGAFKIIKNEWKKAGILQERLKRTEDEFFRKAIYGGRCEVFKREFLSNEYGEIKKGNLKYDDISDYLIAPDVNSLYPAVMRNNKYPIGRAILTSKEIKDRCGIYRCIVNKPNNLLYPILCSNGEYNLNDDEGVYTYYDICKARENGYNIKIISGYYWEESEYIFKNYIEEFFEIKKNAVKGSPEYANSKLMMNALYGKTIQRDKNTINYTVSNSQEIVNMKKGKNLKKFSGVFIGDVGYFEYEEELKPLTDKKPHIGAYILSYSKNIINEALKEVDPYYTDTDSLYIHSKDQYKLKWGPELGEFSNDVNGKIICAYFVAKKLKYCEVITSDNKIELCYTGKGCDTSTLTKNNFKQMIKGLEVENITRLNFKRNVRGGTIEKRENLVKIIKMNDGKRNFINGNSYPYGYNNNL